MGNGAAAADDLAALVIQIQGADDGPGVHAGVGVKAGILGGNGGLDAGRRDVVQGQRGVQALVRVGDFV